MTNTQQLHPIKRVITFIMALLMFLSVLNTFALSVDAAQVSVQLWVYVGDSGVTANFSSYWNTFGNGTYKANGFNSLDTGASLKDVLSTQNIACYTDLASNLTRTGYDLVGFDISKFGAATVSGVPSFDDNTSKYWPVTYISYDDFVAANSGSYVYGAQGLNWAFQLLPDWEAHTHTLTLNANGGKIDGSDTKTYTIKYGQSYKDAFSSVFPTPVRDGYEFQYYDYNNGIFGLTENNWANNYYSLDESATMVARWKCLHVSKTLISTVPATCTQTGTKTEKCNECEETITTTLPKIAHDRAWETFTTGNGYDLYKCKVCGDFNKKRINVTYNANGGSVTVNNQSQVSTTVSYETDTTNEGAAVTFTPNVTATMSGSQFLGWSTDPYASEPDTTFSSTQNYTLHAIYGKETYTITFDPGQDDTLTPAKPGKMPDGIDTVVNIQYDNLLSDAVSPTIPVPTLPGYTFVGWRVYNNGVKGGIYTASTWATSRYRPDPVGSTVFKAEYTPNAEYTLTLRVNGGTLPSGYTTTYKFLKGQLFSDVIGGYPVPTREDYAFTGWQIGDYTNLHWVGTWGTQPYDFDQNVILDARWKATPYRIIFDLNDDETNPATQETGYALSYGIAKGDSIATIVGGFPVPTRPNYTFKGWGMTVKQINPETGKEEDVLKTFTPEEGWGDTVHQYEMDVQIVANWRWWCDHKDDNGKYHTLSWEDGEQRDYGTCPECHKIGAYGYEVKLWNKSGTICLSEKLPMEDLFKLEGTSDNLIFDKETSRVIDYLDDDNDPKIMIDFNPCLVAAKNTENAWVGWTYVDSRGESHTIAHENKYGWQYIFDDDYVDPGPGNPQDGPLRNTHLWLYAVYTEGYYEVIFDGGVNNDTNGEAPNGDGVIVDSDRRYGVMAIKQGQTYKDCLYYIPTAKHTENGVLYCSVGWKHSSTAHIENHEHLIDCTSWNDGQLYQHATDSIIYAHYKYYNEDNKEYQNSDGYLSTYYANNKYAHMNGGIYNNAYFDPDENSGGTMYYIYYRPTDGNGNYLEYAAGMEYAYDIENDPNQENKYPVVCEPLFAYDPVEDYRHAFKFTPTTHDAYKADFNINVYLDELLEHGVVIAKEPKRYTIYVGEGTHFVFPTLVCDPMGDTGSDTLPAANMKTVNGNTFYTDLNGKNFFTTHNDNDAQVMFIFTEATTLGTYNLANPVFYPAAGTMHMGLLPYIDNAGKTNKQDIHNYETIFPYANKGVYFHAPFTEVNGKDEKLYVDYNRNSYYGDGYWVYGSGMKLTYPNNHGTLNPAFTEQYAYYQQWDYSVKFNANYPTGQVPDGGGYTDSDTVYSLVSPFGKFYVYDDDLFTLDNYVITGWSTDPTGKNGVWFDADTEYEAKSAMCMLQTAGITLYAQWEKVVNFTLVEGGSGANPFAWVTYTDASSGTSVTDSNITETRTFKCLYGTEVTVSNVTPASGNEFAYFTWNNNYKSNIDSGDTGVNLRLVSDRILTNRHTYTFTIVAHSSMTAQFVKSGSTTGFYIDRNNKLLRSNSDPWALYTTASPRTNTAVANDETLDRALYYEYNSTASYTVTVSGSTYTALNKDHTVLYDDVLTLMTDSVSGGNKFVGWKIGDKFVSYEPVYKHRVSGDATVTAVYSGTAAASVTLLSNADDVIVMQRNAPNGYTLVESGFLLTTDATELTFDQLCDKSGTYRLTTTDYSINGTFKLRLKTGNYYGYGFAIYKDQNGNLVIVTTDWLTI